MGLRVAIVVGDMESGGVEAVLMNLLRELHGKDTTFELFLHQRSSFLQRDELDRMGVRYHFLPFYGHPLRYHQTLVRLLREGRYHIVHAHLSTISVFPLVAAWRAGVPARICHTHTTASMGERTRWLLKVLLRPFACLFATHYFACGQAAGRWLYGKRRMARGQVWVLPNGIDRQRFCFDSEARAKTRKALGIANTDFVMGHVGRFTYPKNHEFLIDIFEQVHRVHPHSRLVLVGDGEQIQRICALVRMRGLEDAVLFPGVCQQVQYLYSAMDAFVLPSHFEGLPVVALEAQQNGLPCFFSDRITQEILLSDNAEMLSLKMPSAVWAKKILASSRVDGSLPDLYDLHEQANLLHAVYHRLALNKKEAEG